MESIDEQYRNIIKYKPLRGSSYIEIPPDLELRNSTKGLIKLQNIDNECFRWCLIRHLNPQQKYPQRIKKCDKECIKNLDYMDVTFPVAQKDYRKIEIMNNTNINVFGYEKQEPYPGYVSKEKFNDMLNLLLIRKGKEQHYVLVKDFNKFMYNQTKHANRKHFCMHCLQCSRDEKALNNHKENFITINGAQAIKLPKAHDMVYFKNYQKGLAALFVIYADFEAITEKVYGCQPNNDKSYTASYQKHEDCRYGYEVVCRHDDKYSKPVHIHRGENAVHKFMDKMLEEIEWCKKMKHKHFNKDMILTKDDELNLKDADKCHIYDKEYFEKDIRARDHCHVTGKYRVSAHQDCNINYRLTDKIPVIFHNLRGYDSHFIMQTIGEIANKHTYKNNKGEEKQMDINLIPNNMEKYMAFMLGKHLVFIESFQFMSSSLDKLVRNLLSDAFRKTKAYETKRCLSPRLHGFI